TSLQPQLDAQLTSLQCLLGQRPFKAPARPCWRVGLADRTAESAVTWGYPGFSARTAGKYRPANQLRGNGRGHFGRIIKTRCDVILLIHCHERHEGEGSEVGLQRYRYSSNTPRVMASDQGSTLKLGTKHAVSAKGLNLTKPYFKALNSSTTRVTYRIQRHSDNRVFPWR
ncbi:unnamed protein product, partial [Tuber aestivum]